MDSVSQAALGAAVGIVVMGRSRPVWQAALAGAVIGTLPDLDVLIDKGDPIRDMVLHRAETHALFWQALASPLIALLPAWLNRSLGLYRRWWLLTLLALWTHALLDAMTVYGTRLLLPFSEQPFGLGSIFIIDPLYTLPLLLGVLLALLLRSARKRRWNTAGLTLSTLYLGWSLGAQAHVRAVVDRAVAAHDLTAQHILVTPTPFNTLLWRVLLVDDAVYREGFYSLLDPLHDPAQRLRFDTFDRGAALDRITTGFADANLIRDFSHGLYAMQETDAQIRITDLRMGQTPYFAFSFAFATHNSDPVAIPPRRFSQRIPLAQGIDWLRQRVAGMDLPPPR